ncbi:DUF2510 domain-containing protein [Kitasatospora sp. NPDC097643]|uniref:DUF2510 domain-containing protein n=1 Tax=Kitasatospora sp. NPDC097643 TaxID=3157230 RepID=UPI003331B113
MSNSTPPGWYPVPGADGTPGHERWWDGNAWTSEVRPLQGGAAQLSEAPTQGWQPGPQKPGYGYPGGTPNTPGYGYPGGVQAPGYGYPGQEAYPTQEAYPAQDGYPGQAAGYGYAATAYLPQQTQPSGSKTGAIIGITVGVLAVGGIIAGIMFSGGGDDTKADPTPNPTVTITQSVNPAPSPTGRTATPTPTPTPTAPKPVPSVKSTVPDPAHAITVPVFEGWDAQTNGTRSSVFLGAGRYTCPDGNACIRGQFSIEKEAAQGANARAAAEATMPGYAGKVFTGITEHTDAGSGYTTIAGVSAYAVRWHIRTSDGSQGYVLLATAPAKEGGYVVFEGGVDDDPNAPDFSVVDQILSGIKLDTTAGTGSST